MAPNFPRAIIRLRLLLALSQAKFAESVGVSLSAIANIEHGRRCPGQNLIDRVAERYGVDLYVYAWAMERRERFGVEIVAAMDAAVKARRAA